MFGTRRNLSSRVTKECHRTTDRGCKIQKAEGNRNITNITAKRVTLPPCFLRVGVNSGNTRKCTGGAINKKRAKLSTSDKSENNSETKNLRRSARIINNKFKPFSATDYFSDILVKDYNNITLKENSPPFRPKPILKDNSKSIFRDINLRIQAKQNRYLNLRRSVNQQGPKIFSINKNFNKKLNDQLTVRFRRDVISETLLNIKSNIEDINSFLSGKKIVPDKMSKTEKVVETNKTENDSDIDFIPIPKANWIFKTPPRRRFVVKQAEESIIKPAVIFTSKKESKVFQLRPKLNVDLTNLKHRQNIPIDNRYLQHVTTFNKDTTEPMDYNEKTTDNTKTEMTDMEKHFLTLTSRPTKTIKRMSVANRKKRKLNLDDTPTDCALLETVEEFEASFTMMEQTEQFKFQFNSSMFNNNSNENDGKLFQFDNKENEPKMFNFGKMQ